MFKEREITVTTKQDIDFVVSPSGKYFFDPEVVELYNNYNDLLKQNRALITEVKLLHKCLDEASEARDKYKAKIDNIKSAFDDYAIRSASDYYKTTKEYNENHSCATCKWHDRKCYRPTSDNFGEITDDEYGCKRYESQ